MRFVLFSAFGPSAKAERPGSVEGYVVHCVCLPFSYVLNIPAEHPTVPRAGMART